MIVIAFHPEVLDAIVRMIRRYTYPKGEAISDRTYNAGYERPADGSGRRPEGQNLSPLVASQPKRIVEDDCPQPHHGKVPTEQASEGQQAD
jgi:hypothetical protein